jgi:hypothetical protein
MMIKKKKNLSQVFCIFRFESTFTSFKIPRLKVIKKSQNSRIQSFSYLMEGSGSALLTNGSDPGGPKTLDPIRIRIRNTAVFIKEKSRIFRTISGLREDPNPYQIKFWITRTLLLRLLVGERESKLE